MGTFFTHDLPSTHTHTHTYTRTVLQRKRERKRAGAIATKIAAFLPLRLSESRCCHIFRSQHSLTCISHSLFPLCHWHRNETTNLPVCDDFLTLKKRQRVTIKNEKGKKVTDVQAPTFAPDEAEAGLWSSLESPRAELPAVRPISDILGFIRFSLLRSLVYRW